MALMKTNLRGMLPHGERMLYRFFDRKLSNQYHVWNNLRMPVTGEEIDFVILHPEFGMWVIEVKDWVIEQINKVDSENSWVVIRGQEKKFPSPMAQAYRNFIAVKSRMDNQSELLHPEGNYKGKLLFAIHDLVIFTNITRSELHENNLETIFPDHKVITADNISNKRMDGPLLEELFLEKRNLLVRYLNPKGLSSEQVSVIDRVFNPSVTLGETAGESDETQAGGPESDWLSRTATPAYTLEDPISREMPASAIVPQSVGDAMERAMLESLEYIVELNDQILKKMWK